MTTAPASTIGRANYFDKETNSHYNYYRDYDPAIGRYIQSDPIGLKGGLNLYLYVDGNPLIRFDRRGLTFELEFPPDPLAPPPNLGITCAIGVANDTFERARREGWVRNDKRIHCVASCEIVRQCGSATLSMTSGVGREIYQIIQGGQFKESFEDERANWFGLACPAKKDCYQHCVERF